MDLEDNLIVMRDLESLRDWVGALEVVNQELALGGGGGSEHHERRDERLAMPGATLDRPEPHGNAPKTAPTRSAQDPQVAAAGTAISRTAARTPS